MEKTREFQERIYFCFIDCTKAFDYLDTANCGKLLEMEVPDTLPVSWEICMQVKKQQLEPDM